MTGNPAVREEQVKLRPVTEADDGFIFSVYASTRAQEMAQVPWSAEQKEAFVRMQYTAQKQHYVAKYPRASHDIIYIDAIPGGRLYLDRGEDVVHILDITVLPEHRSQGVGSVLMRRILDEAGKIGKPVTIFVESFNPSVGLFARLGFEKAQENGFQLLLQWCPKS
jgi:GNAT superfamily N-acetyltransferase